MKNYLKVLGCRGSVPVSGKRFEKYGGATSSYMLRLGGSLIIIDAGSGIMAIDYELGENEKNASLFITHSHADHILGFPMCCLALCKEYHSDIYMKTRNHLDAKAQLNSYLKEPNWPVDCDKLPGDFSFYEIEEEMKLKANPEITIKSLEACHPGGSSLLRFEYKDIAVVMATDCTITDSVREKSLAFARDASLILIDGQYAPGKVMPGFGHNSWHCAAEFAKEAGAKIIRIVHHDPHSSDDILDKAASELLSISPDAAPAFEGEIIRL